MMQVSIPSQKYAHENHLACFPYGVGHSNEGVCLLLKMGSHHILLDCGISELQPLTKNQESTPDAVFCTHAHRDHAQGLLALHQAFPELPIYASEVTTQLLPLNWQEEEDEKIPNFCQALEWRSPIQLFPDLTAELFPAGHIPGAAAILLSYYTQERTYKVFYTGDFSLSNFQLVEGLSVEALRGTSPDVLIIEGSYGTARHPHRRQQEKQLMARIKQALNNNQNVLLPVPTLGLGQEILKLLRSHHQFTGQDLDIWVDGNLIRACDIYLKLLPQLPVSVQNFAKHQALFWDQRVCPRMGKFPWDHEALEQKTPCIILSDRLDRLNQYFSGISGKWLVLLPEHTHLWLAMATDDNPVTALQAKFSNQSGQIAIESYLLAEHSDGRNTTQLIHNLRPQHVIFMHSSPHYLADLTSLEELQNRYQLHSPKAGTLVELPIGDKFIQPAVPQPSNYEGEITEQGNFITITLPDHLKEDSRWQNFADTGLLEARWQGEQLLLRGLSHKELLSQTSNARILAELDCCGTCRHQRSQRCWNRSSPLYGFKVTSDGYCPVFEPLPEED